MHTLLQALSQLWTPEDTYEHIDTPFLSLASGNTCCAVKFKLCIVELGGIFKTYFQSVNRWKWSGNAPFHECPPVDSSRQEMLVPEPQAAVVAPTPGSTGRDWIWKREEEHSGGDFEHKGSGTPFSLRGPLPWSPWCFTSPLHCKLMEFSKTHS